MLSATGNFNVLTINECRGRISLYIECLNDLFDAIDDDDVIDKQWLECHIFWLNCELNIYYNEDNQ